MDTVADAKSQLRLDSTAADQYAAPRFQTSQAQSQAPPTSAHSGAPTLFDGATYNSARDGARLESQAAKVAFLMADKRWRSLAAIAALVGGSEAGVSARLRDFRKKKFGSKTVERRYISNGQWEYRVL